MNGLNRGSRLILGVVLRWNWFLNDFISAVYGHIDMCGIWVLRVTFESFLNKQANTIRSIRFYDVHLTSAEADRAIARAAV